MKSETRTLLFAPISLECLGFVTAKHIALSVVFLLILSFAKSRLLEFILLKNLHILQYKIIRILVSMLADYLLYIPIGKKFCNFSSIFLDNDY